MRWSLGAQRRRHCSHHHFTVGVKLRYAARLYFKDPSDRCSNNTTEYEVLLLGLRKVRALRASNFLVKCDARVIKDHVEKRE
jgi:ribonuclease HI